MHREEQKALSSYEVTRPVCPGDHRRPLKALLVEYGFTVDNVVAAAKAQVTPVALS